MAKVCKKEECNNPVFSRLFCKNHQYLAVKNRKKTAKVKMKSKSKVRKKKLITIPQYHKLLWEITSIAYRVNDADELGMCKCATCNNHLYYFGTRISQMGHFVSRQKTVIKYERTNQLTQCAKCNGPSGKGEQYLMGLALNKRFGEGTAKKMIIASKKPVKPYREFFKRYLVDNAILLIEESKNKNLKDWKKGMFGWKVKLIEQIYSDSLLDLNPYEKEYICSNYRIP